MGTNQKKILELLDINNDITIQKLGIKDASQEKDFAFFISSN